ncbi:MAG: glucose 1-dehydrogenase [Pseudomonadota bacterium]
MTALEDQRALVTGGGSGIGLACARAFVQDGAHVTIMGRNEERLKNAVEELQNLAASSQVNYLAGDVGDEASVAEAVALAAGGQGLDIAIANAGQGSLAPVMVEKTETWDSVMQTNLTGTFYTIKHAAQSMARSGGGAICTISSIAGVRTHRNMSTYCVSKAGIDMLVRNAADELGQSNIRVNSVCPGLVDTEIAAGLMTTDEVYQDYMDCMPIRRNGQPNDIANAVRFLCGPESSWVTGVVLSVDGGHHLRRGPNLDPFVKMIYGHETQGLLAD